MSAKIAVAGLLKFMGMAVYFGLFAYFVSRVIMSAKRLSANKLGLSEEVVVSTEIEYPSMTACVRPYQEEALKEGKMKDRFWGISYFNGKKRDQVDMNGPRNRPPTFVTFGAMNPYYFTSDWCLTYNPQVAIPAGFANKVSMYIDTNQSGAVDVYVHNKNQMYIPNLSGAFGTAHYSIVFDNSIERIGLYQYLEVGFVERKSLDRPTSRCNSSLNTKPDVFGCLRRHVENQTRCRQLGNITHSDHLPLCTEADANALVKASKPLADGDRFEIEKKTGCFVACSRKIYSIRPYTELRNEGKHPGIIWIHLFLASSARTVTTQYVIYDVNSFVADVGGYLGLLLGHSLLGIYRDTVAAVAKKLCSIIHV